MFTKHLGEFWADPPLNVSRFELSRLCPQQHATLCQIDAIPPDGGGFTNPAA